MLTEQQIKFREAIEEHEEALRLSKLADPHRYKYGDTERRQKYRRPFRVPIWVVIVCGVFLWNAYASAKGNLPIFNVMGGVAARQEGVNDYLNLQEDIQLEMAEVINNIVNMGDEEIEDGRQKIAQLVSRNTTEDERFDELQKNTAELLNYTYFALEYYNNYKKEGNINYYTSYVEQLRSYSYEASRRQELTKDILRKAGMKFETLEDGSLRYWYQKKY